jgi:hypothetical protein
MSEHDAEADAALWEQRLAHRIEVWEAVHENVLVLEALRDLLVSSGAPPGMGLGEALMLGYVSVEEVVESIRAVPDPLAE